MRNLALCLFAVVAASQAVAQGDIVGDPAMFTALDAGVLCASDAGAREPAPGTRLGFIDLVEGDITVGLSARQIPAVPGLAFGVVATVADGSGATGVTIIVTHPPMGADGNVRETWQSDFVAGDTTGNFFRFDYPEERVPGDWMIQAELGGRVLYTARFRVVDPSEMPWFTDPCALPPQLS